MTRGDKILFGIMIVMVVFSATILVFFDVVGGTTTEFKETERECTSLLQETKNETLYYQCWSPMDNE